MINKNDRLKAGLQPLLAKTLENALASKDYVHHGQIVWTAVSIDNPPARHKKMADTDLITVVLDASTDEDIQSRIDRVPPGQWRLRKAIRMCRQAYEQGGLLNNQDLSEILNFADSLIAQLLSNHERQTKTLIPRRGTIHDAGNSLSHKWIICHKRYVEGKSADQIARETYHCLEAVDRYLGQFDRVRHCLQQGLSTMETAHILNCGVSLVEAYRQIEDLKGVVSEMISLDPDNSSFWHSFFLENLTSTLYVSFSGYAGSETALGSCTAIAGLGPRFPHPLKPLLEHLPRAQFG